VVYYLSLPSEQSETCFFDDSLSVDMDSSLEAPPLSASASASGLPWQGLFGLRSTLRGAETLDS